LGFWGFGCSDKTSQQKSWSSSRVMAQAESCTKRARLGQVRDLSCPSHNENLWHLEQVQLHGTGITSSGDPSVAALGLDVAHEAGVRRLLATPQLVWGGSSRHWERVSHSRQTDEVIREWFHYIRNCSASQQACAQGYSATRGAGRVKLEDFAKSTQAIHAHINLAHVLALRLYTSPAFKVPELPSAHSQMRRRG